AARSASTPTPSSSPSSGPAERPRTRQDADETSGRVGEGSASDEPTARTSGPQGTEFVSRCCPKLERVLVWRAVAGHDLVSPHVLVVDGRGLPRRRADVAVTDGRIVEIGFVEDKGARELDADGRVVAPGFVDPHTHYDPQLTFEPYAT